jgi:Na+/H+ antiporter NhaC
MLESITWGTYIFFAAFCLLAFAFTFFCIPETRGKVRSETLYFSMENIAYERLTILTTIPQTLEDMDLIFGDTAAHEEKKRIKHIEAELRGTPIEEDDLIKPVDSHVEQA